jgi:glycosyltransferase involved in cell wall biosynthesis
MQSSATQILVSVIIPTHNRPLFLKKTIESILSQTYKNLQIIIISNGYNKNNYNVANSFNDPRIEFYYQKNSGTAASPRNKGILFAKGEYIAFCDDDDLWLPTKIEKQVLNLSKNLDYAGCFSKMIRFDYKKEWTIPNEEGRADFRSLLYSNTIPISSLIIRSNFVKDLGSFSTSKLVGVCPDYELVLRYTLKSKLLFLDEYLIKYWSGDSRTTNTDENRTFTQALTYFSYIMGCYYICYKENKVPLKDFFLPTLFNVKNLVKTLGYLSLKKLRLK